MSGLVGELIAVANRLAGEGKWGEAEEAWRRVHQAEPRNPKGLFGLGIHALQRGDAATAIRYLSEACEVAPADLFALMTLARARQAAGDPAGELDAISRALVVDAYYLPGLLAKANFTERHGRAADAAFAYRNALIVAPPKERWPDVLRQQLEHAEQVVARHQQSFARFLDEALAAKLAALSPQEHERWRESMSIMTGATKPYLSDSNQLTVPRLPAIPFFDKAMFPWAGQIESQTEVIRTELMAALEADRERFAPYIAYKPGDPVNQWQELNHSLRWSTYQLWRAGAPDPEGQARCPQTTAALRAVEMADIAGLCPNAMFSALAPRTRIPPHHGETNARLVVHLPLIVPENCSYRVGFEWRKWEVGKLLIFDDTIEHEARNDSDELRVVLIFDVWNPLISAAERDMVRAMTTVARTYSTLD